MTLFMTPRRAVAFALLTFTLCGQALAQSGEPDRSLNARLLVAASWKVSWVPRLVASGSLHGAAHKPNTRQKVFTFGFTLEYNAFSSVPGRALLPVGSVASRSSKQLGEERHGHSMA